MGSKAVFVKNAKRYLQSPFFRAHFYFTDYYEKGNIKDDEIFFESYSANNFSGNVYYLFLEICKNPELNHFKKYVACNKNNKLSINNKLKSLGINNYKLVEVHSREYCKKLAECKYLFNNSTLPSYFIKNDKQIYVNTWHGTPLKTLGRSIKNTPAEIGNTQRNFFMADYLLYPNEFTFDHLREDFMLDQLYSGKYVISGYPRNDIFYNLDHQNKIREELELKDKEIICYMPTWRGTMDAKDTKEQLVTIQYYLYQIDKHLKENQILYVNLHNFISEGIDFGDYKNILPFPREYETYEFLSIADCLITDYSSVFFDFANTGRKIILFAYDKEDYFSLRGTYFPMDELPFPIVDNLNGLFAELDNIKHYESYQKFNDVFCNYDSKDQSKKIVDLIFNNESSDLKIIDGSNYKNNKKNIMIFAGGLIQNGITASLRSLLNNIDASRYNIFVTFYRSKVKKYNYVIEQLPRNINYISMQGQKDYTPIEAISQFSYMNLNIDNKCIDNNLKKLYRREMIRSFYHNHFDVAIHFTGYERHIAYLFLNFDNCKRIIYAHNNMVKEKNTKSNYHIPTITKAYEEYERIAIVRNSMVEEIAEISPKIDLNKIRSVHNVNDINRIMRDSKKDLKFDILTESTHSVDQINKILNDNSIFKYINIARFSPEKGLMRLVKGYRSFVNDHPDTCLFIIGGYGNDYQEILDYVLDNKLDKVVLIKSLSNVYPILSKCDVFFLSSFYEGLPMTIMEALILDKPVVCTNITGPREFLSQGYGYLVPDSDDGIYQGFEDSYRKDLNLKKFDAEAFNKQAIEEFYSLIDD